MLGIVRRGIFWSIILVALIIAVALPSPAFATPNLQINYQGRLTDSSGNPVTDGSYNMEFKLHNDIESTGGAQGACSGSCVFMETLTDTNKVVVANGLFSVMIGSITPLTGVDFNQTLYLSVNIGGSDSPSWDGEMTPRRPLGAVAAAFEASRLAGLNSAQFLRTDATNATSTASTFVTFNQSGAGKALDVQISGNTRLNVAGTGNVGIGTTTPYATLSVVGEVAATYFTATSTTATSTFAGALGIATSSPAGKLGVNGKVFLAGLSSSAAGDTALCLSAGKEVRLTSGTDCTLSSARFKQNITDLAVGLSEVLRLRPVSFQYLGTTDNHVGLIAEEVQRVEPRLVFYEDDGITPRGVRYTELTALLTKSIQELSARVDNLSGGLAGTSFNTNQQLSVDGVGRLVVKELKTDRLCVGETCISEADLRKLLNLPEAVDNFGGGAVIPVSTTVVTAEAESAKMDWETKAEAPTSLPIPETVITIPETKPAETATE